MHHRPLLSLTSDMWTNLLRLQALAIIFYAGEANARALKFVCIYHSYVDASGEGSKDAEGFKLEFAYDTISKRAVMIGNVGVENVLGHSGSAGTTFLEFLPTGAVQSTTIANTGESVHSRHSMLPGKLIATQYYGSCKMTSGAL